MPIPTSFIGGDFKFTIVLSTALYIIEPKAREGKRVFKFFIALSATKKGFGFTIDLYINFSIKPKAKRDFKLGLLSANAVRFSGNSTKGDFRYMALYIEFPVGKLRGYSKGIFEFSMEPCPANVPFIDIIFGAS